MRRLSGSHAAPPSGLRLAGLWLEMLGLAAGALLPELPQEVEAVSRSEAQPQQLGFDQAICTQRLVGAAADNIRVELNFKCGDAAKCGVIKHGQDCVLTLVRTSKVRA